MLITPISIFLSLITFVSHDAVPQNVMITNNLNSSVIIRADIELAKIDKNITNIHYKHKTLRNRFICSGVVIDNNNSNELLILTAGHCGGNDNVEISEDNLTGEPIIVTTTPVSVKFKNGDVGKVESLYNDKDDDLMVLKVKMDVNSSVHGSVVINTGSLVPLQSLYGIGAPQENYWSVIDIHSVQGSTVVNQNANNWNYTYQIESPAMDKGISGGGVFDLSDGELVGIMVGSNGSNGMGVMIPAIRIKKWLLQEISNINY
jgi:S1-C subfamily serine protease